MKCNHCGANIDNESNFCEFCGKKVKKKMPVWAVLLIVLGCVVVLGLGMVTGLLISGNSDSKEKPAPDPVVDTLVEAPVYEETMEAPASVAEVVPQGYVDLGLPSGTLWKNRNESGFYDYDEAVRSFGSRLPTKAQLEELKNKCKWTWIKGKERYYVIGPNGNSIFLPAAGYRSCGGVVNGVGADGNYWSSTPGDSGGAWYLYFYSGGVGVNLHSRCSGRSVRLVQNEH